MSTDTTLVYTGLIAPLGSKAPPGSGEALDAPDRRDGFLYIYDPHLQMAVEVALATGRPLLLRGEPGSGKSSLAAFIARNLGYRYYETVITSHSSASRTCSEVRSGAPPRRRPDPRCAGRREAAVRLRLHRARRAVVGVRSRIGHTAGLACR
ncbi:MAG: ATP-binding protein [Rhodocyclaceae bacterium]